MYSVCLPLLVNKAQHMHVSWYCRERVEMTDTEEKKLLNKVVIFVFSVHKKYSRSFIKFPVEPLMLHGLFYLYYLSGP